MTKKASELRDMLSKAHASGALVRLRRSCDDGFINGLVSLLSDELFVVCAVSDEIRYDGFHALRFGDLVTVLSPAPHHEFVQRALALRKLRRPVNPKIDVSCLSSLLTTASAGFPLVTIHRETLDSDVCQIGKVVKVTEKTVTLREITPDATWERRPRRYTLREITRVDFGGGYEDALHLVAKPLRS